MGIKGRVKQVSIDVSADFPMEIKPLKINQDLEHRRLHVRRTTLRKYKH